MNQTNLVRIVDRCLRLTRRQYDVDQGRPVIDDELIAAFDEACMSIWGVTDDEVDWDIVPEQPEYGYN